MEKDILKEYNYLQNSIKVIKMNKLYVVKDGVVNIGYVINKVGERLKNTNF